MQKSSRFHGSERNHGAKDSIGKLLLRYFPIVLFCSFFLLVGLSLVCYFQKDPRMWIIHFGWLASGVTYFIAGLIVAKAKKSNFLFCGLICAGVLTAISLLLSLLFKNQISDTVSLGESLIVRGLLILSSIWGAYLGIKPKRKKKPKERRFH